MSLYKDWDKLLNGQTKETIDEFWKEYSEAEARIYAYILSNHNEHLKGKVSDLAEKFECDKVIFTGFLDGVTTSLKNELDVTKITLDSEIDLDIDFEKLYFNMHKADADYLWGLEEWNDVLFDFRKEGDIDVAELGCRVLRSESGNGYGAEAFYGVLHWALESGLVSKVVAKCFHQNMPSFVMLSKEMKKTGEDKTFKYFELQK